MPARALKGSQDELPIMTPAFYMYTLAGTGRHIGLSTVAVPPFGRGNPVPGTVLRVTVQYVRTWFLLEAPFRRLSEAAATPKHMSQHP